MTSFVTQAACESGEDVHTRCCDQLNAMLFQSLDERVEFSRVTMQAGEVIRDQCLALCADAYGSLKRFSALPTSVGFISWIPTDKRIKLLIRYS